jgi:hypothetical protein
MKDIALLLVMLVHRKKKKIVPETHEICHSEWAWNKHNSVDCDEELFSCFKEL